MENEKGILSLAESMELTMDKSNLSVVGDIGEVIIDAAMDDGIFKDSFTGRLIQRNMWTTERPTCATVHINFYA